MSGSEKKLFRKMKDLEESMITLTEIPNYKSGNLGVIEQENVSKILIDYKNV